MKLFCTIFLLLNLIFTGLNAQGKFVPQKTTFYRWDKLDWELQQETFYRYNKRGDVTEANTKDKDGKYSHREVTVYNQNYLEVGKYKYKFDTAENKWRLYQSSETEYHKNNKKAKNVVFNYDENGEPAEKSITDYNVDGKLIEGYNYKFNSGNWKIIGGGKYTYIDSAGLNETEISMRYDTISKEFKNIRKTVTRYNAKKDILSGALYYWRNQVWKLHNEYEYLRDNTGKYYATINNYGYRKEICENIKWHNWEKYQMAYCEYKEIVGLPDTHIVKNKRKVYFEYPDEFISIATYIPDDNTYVTTRDILINSKFVHEGINLTLQSTWETSSHSKWINVFEGDKLVEEIYLSWNYNEKQLEYKSRKKHEFFTEIPDTTYIDFINIYPNPVKDKLNVKINLIETSEGNISIYDVTGKMLLSSNISLQQGENLTLLNVEILNPGIYIVKVNMNNGLSSTQKIIRVKE